MSNPHHFLKPITQTANGPVFKEDKNSVILMILFCINYHSPILSTALNDETEGSQGSDDHEGTAKSIE